MGSSRARAAWAKAGYESPIMDDTARLLADQALARPRAGGPHFRIVLDPAALS